MENKNAVSTGELTKGDYVTVYAWKDSLDYKLKEFTNEIKKAMEDEGEVGFQTMMPIPLADSTTLKYLMGNVLEVKAISLPYVLIKDLTDASNGGVIFHIDTRECDLMLLNDEYVKTIKEDNTRISNLDDDLSIILEACKKKLSTVGSKQLESVSSIEIDSQYDEDEL